jgi:EAL domain-containing protein (putative c-di-GMP-specific phosphodiesterase class I)
LKIDRKFVADLVVSAHDKAIVKAVCDIARPRDIMVVAEGVEPTSN